MPRNLNLEKYNRQRPTVLCAAIGFDGLLLAELSKEVPEEIWDRCLAAMKKPAYYVGTVTSNVVPIREAASGD